MMCWSSKVTVDSIDREERLIPYVDECVVKVDLAEQRIVVNWDPGF